MRAQATWLCSAHCLRLLMFYPRPASVSYTHLFVVTEHGIAYLHGKSLRERAEALIVIAHPKFQADLEDFAVRAHYLERKQTEYA